MKSSALVSFCRLPAGGSSLLPLWPGVWHIFRFCSVDCCWSSNWPEWRPGARHLLKFNDICLFMASYCQVSAQSRLLWGHFGLAERSEAPDKAKRPALLLPLLAGSGTIYQNQPPHWGRSNAQATDALPPGCRAQRKCVLHFNLNRKPALSPHNLERWTGWPGLGELSPLSLNLTWRHSAPSRPLRMLGTMSASWREFPFCTGKKCCLYRSIY